MESRSKIPTGSFAVLIMASSCLSISYSLPVDQFLMESAAALRSCYGSLGNFSPVLSLLDRPGGLPFCSANSNKSSFCQGWTFVGRLVSSVNRKTALIPHVKASGSILTSDVVSSNGSSQGPSAKKVLQGATFPNGFEALVLEVCDETDVAELKIKVGDFEMHLKRNIEATKPPPHVTSPSIPPPIPSEPMVELASVASSTSPPKSSPETTSPFRNISTEKSSKLAALEASGSNAHVLITSPTVGKFRRGRTVKGKKQPPICKEGDVIKEGQTIGFLDQFGGELPVKSDVAGEVLKLLYLDGEAVGYGDPLVAVLPSFHDINIMSRFIGEPSGVLLQPSVTSDLRGFPHKVNSTRTVIHVTKVAGTAMARTVTMERSSKTAPQNTEA
ncbi:hypothetical protein NE237_004768 [Protea cynaroides]|uniref:Lipoyl-binding domain-containing protein n=1 Tax=Protea cynaroides TaxID=273540 RepID=A0A9Q0QU01_9MAGN|nr:hypothetical protein NE237_004768 [Protea cynaroides]